MILNNIRKRSGNPPFRPVSPSSALVVISVISLQSFPALFRTLRMVSLEVEPIERKITIVSKLNPGALRPCVENHTYGKSIVRRRCGHAFHQEILKFRKLPQHFVWMLREIPLQSGS